MSEAVARDLIGWSSSLVLLLTISVQIRRQWRARRTESVSPWLFIGQLTANCGFIVYSAMLGSWVFIVTNAALACASLTGWIVLLVHRRREEDGGSTSAPHQAAGRASIRTSKDS
jgi:MtN3 and saliva related transmembrane protein